MEIIPRFALISLSLLAVGLLFLFIASGGGVWSVSSDFNYGLHQITFGSGDFTVTYPNSDAYDDVDSAGQGTTAFLVLSVLSGFAYVGLVLAAWPLNRLHRSRSFLLPVAGIYCFCVFLTWVIWAGAAHKRITNDSKAQGAPSVSLGYCWALTLIAWLLSLPNLFVAHKLRVYATGGSEYPSSDHQPSVPYQSATYGTAQTF